MREEAIAPFANRVLAGDAATRLRELPADSVHLVVTSPPYWNLVDYRLAGQLGQSSYEQFLEDLLAVWRECYRVLAPNGKLCINTPILPVPKKVLKTGHTRHLKNLNNDIEASLLRDGEPHLERYSLFVWQKQTTVKMFGSYPYPPNIYEDNTIEFIAVYVKPGTPRKLPQAVKEASKLTQKEWLNLTMQVWPMYPHDVARKAGHPAPFPLALPERLIRMYTFAAVPKAGFAGDIVLDPFNGTGTTCLAAKAAGRRYIGIDLSEEYCRIAEERLASGVLKPSKLLLPRVQIKQAHARPEEQTLFPT